jgi:hypothetical protein
MDVAKTIPVTMLRRMRAFFSLLSLSIPMILKPLVKKFYFVGVIPESRIIKERPPHDQQCAPPHMSQNHEILSFF